MRLSSCGYEATKGEHLCDEVGVAWPRYLCHRAAVRVARRGPWRQSSRQRDGGFALIVAQWACVSMDLGTKAGVRGTVACLCELKIVL